MPKSEKNKINVKERVDDDTIDLSLSDLSEIPVNEIVKYKRATILDLSSNQIVSLGKNFGLLTHLTKLDLSKNQLKFLSDDIGKLVNLRHLDLYNNKLEHLPISFGRLKSLRYLDLKGNPLATALAKIIGPCVSTKDCQDAARKIVKFMADYQIKLNDMQEQKRIQDELDRKATEEAAAEAERLKRVEKEKLKAKAKKEKKKEKIRMELETNEMDKQQRPNQMNQTKTSSSGAFKSVFRIISFTIILWLLFAAAAIINIIKFPTHTDYVIGKLPITMQPIANEYVKLLRDRIWEFLSDS